MAALRLMIAAVTVLALVWKGSQALELKPIPIDPSIIKLPFCPRPPENAFNRFCVSLGNGSRDPLPPGFSWQSYTPGQGKCCGDEAKLRITPPCWAKSLAIDEISVNSQDWTFNLGDSPTNNGWGGDSGHERYDAEAQILNGNFQVFRNDYCKSSLHPGFGTVPLGGTHQMSLKVTKFGLEYSSTPSGSGMTSCADKCLFEWDTMYLGMNRVIGTPSRDGEGLCQICFNWEPKSFCSKPIIASETLTAADVTP